MNRVLWYRKTGALVYKTGCFGVFEPGALGEPDGLVYQNRWFGYELGGLVYKIRWFGDS